MSRNERLIIVGAGEFADIAFEYFTHDSNYEVCAFAVEKQFLTCTSMNKIPVVALEDIETTYPPGQFKAFVAVTYTQLNRVRTRLYQSLKGRGYEMATYVSSKAFVWHNVQMGENCFIFENNVIQHHVNIGNNVILWSGNHIGHRTVIKDNVYIASHAVVSGYCNIGQSCFLGVNCSFNDKIDVADDCIVGNGAVIVKNTETGKVYVGNPAKPLPISSFDAFKVKS